MDETHPTDPQKLKTVERIREFNRFYLPALNLLANGYLGTEYSITESRVMFELNAADDCMAADIARALNINKSYLSRILRNFERRGWIQRTASKTDARSRALSLTQKGKNQAAEFIQKSNGEIAAIISPLSGDDCERLYDALECATKILLKCTGGNMKNQITMRLARADEAELCTSFIDDARQFQREQGFLQWTDDYPNRAVIEADIAAEKGYVFCADGVPFGYACIDFGGEPAYTDIDGAWLTSLPYAVIHRMAFGAAGRGKGASKNAFALAKDLCRAKGVHALRVDTGLENKGMQHILEREGYTLCGTVQYQNGPRLAYELDF